MHTHVRGIAHRSLAVAVVLAAGVPAHAADPDLSRILDKQVVVAAPVAAVWRAWTTHEGAATFFAPRAKIVVAIGGAYELYFDPSAPAGQRGSEGMRVLSFLPERMLSFSWNAPPKFPRLRGGTEHTWVVVTLQPEGARRTRVTLSHLGWRRGGEWPQLHAYFDRAWGLVLARLQRRFEKGPIDWKNPDGK